MLFQQELKLNLIENGQGGQSNAYLGLIYNPFSSDLQHKII